MIQIQPCTDNNTLLRDMHRLRQRADRLGRPPLKVRAPNPHHRQVEVYDERTESHREDEDYGVAAKRLMPYVILEAVPLGSLVNCIRDPLTGVKGYCTSLAKDVLKLGVYGVPLYGMYKGVEALIS